MEQKLILLLPSQKTTFPLSELNKGAQLSVSDTLRINILELSDTKLVFTVDGSRLTLYRQWQVLNVKDALCYFATEEKAEESQFDKLQEIYSQMNKNESEGHYSDNIPLAKEALHLLKDVAPEEDDDIKTEFCELVVDEELITEKNTPRLLLSFIYFWCVVKNSNRWKQKTQQLLKLIDPKVTEAEKLDIMDSKKRLLYDPIQLTEEWEDAYYDMEQEYQKQSKDIGRFHGSCFTHWSVMKRVAKKYGFDWRTPKEMNPRVRFD